jgi:hypothetical protein
MTGATDKPRIRARLAALRWLRKRGLVAHVEALTGVCGGWWTIRDASTQMPHCSRPTLSGAVLVMASHLRTGAWL